VGRELAQDRLGPPLSSLLRVSDQQGVSVDSGGEGGRETDCMREVEQQLSQEACARPWCTRRHACFAPFTPCTRSKASERLSEWRERGESASRASADVRPSTTLHSL
jgi:hypothetical protein